MAASTQRQSCRALCVVIACAVGIALCLLGFAVISYVRSEAMRISCGGRLSQLAVALDNYHREKGTYPPRFLSDDQGNRLHSWRTLLLPYLDAADLYSQIKLTEPWDSPHNRRSFENASPMVRARFQCPSRQHGIHVTDFAALSSSKLPSQINIGFESQSPTHIAIITLLESDIVWFEPRDVIMAPDDKNWEALQDPRNGFQVLMSNGQAGVLKDNSLQFLNDRQSLIRKWGGENGVR